MAANSLAAFNRAEENWLQTAHRFTEETLVSGSEPPRQSLEHLQDAVIKCIDGVLCTASDGEARGRPTLPLSYSFISLSDLRSQQHTACCSYMSWSTNRFKEWAREGECLMPGQKALPRTHLILIGYLTDRVRDGPTSEAFPDGNLYVRDNTGVMPCEMLQFCPTWLEQLFLFPAWAYIPAQGMSPDAGGYLEISAPPVPVIPQEEEALSQAKTVTALYPPSAAHLLCDRSLNRNAKLTVAGELSRVSCVMPIRGKAFFFLFLKDFSSDVCVPVVVQSPPKLCWFHVLHIGSCYVLTKLRVSSLKTSARKVFAVSSSSELLPFEEGRVREQRLDMYARAPLGGDSASPPLVECSPRSSSVQDCSSLEFFEEESVALAKKSKMLTYKGTVTKVLNAPAGLYELDGSICLCVAYQQIPNKGRGLRPGALVELLDVHFLQRPSEHFPLIVLCCCLRSIVRVRDFSRLCTTYQPFSAVCNLYIYLLFKYNLDLPGYLWMVHTIEALQQKFCSHFVKPRNLLAWSGVPGIVERCLGSVLTSLSLASNQKREVHQEILEEQHWCPLAEYHVLKSPCHVPPLSQVLAMAEQRSWELHPICDLLPLPEAQHMTAQELNRGLAWSFSTFYPGDVQPRAVLLGVLLPSSRSGLLQLQDKTGALPCQVLGKAGGEGSHFWDTALLGCMLQVEQYQLVVERLIQSTFPSWKQLQSTDYIKEKHSKVYVQFFIDNAQILHKPKASPLPQTKGLVLPAVEERDSPAQDKGPLHPAPGDQEETPRDTWMGPPLAKLARVQDSRSVEPVPGRAVTKPPIPSNSDGQPCVTCLLLVLQKDGLLLRNCRVSQQTASGNTQGDGHRGTCHQKAELHLSFHALSVWVGKPHLWTHLGEVQGMPEMEAAEKEWENKALQKVQLVFMGKAIKWNEVLHPEGLYRITVPQESDLDVFARCSTSSIPLQTLRLSDCPLSLPMPDSWRLQYVSSLGSLARYQNVYAALASSRTRVSSIAEILHPSFTGSLVSFCCEVSGRSVCEPDWKGRNTAAQHARQGHDRILPWDVCIKVKVSEPADVPCSLHVYMDISLAPYPLGLLPGARVLFQNLERKTSRINNVYCRSVASSSFTVLEFPSNQHPRLLMPGPQAVAIGSFPLVLFSSLSKPDTLPEGRTICHVTCVIGLTLRWVCSLCTAIFREGRCSQNTPPCASQSGVFQANAKIAVEDGTSEAHVQCRNQQVAALLSLNAAQWEGLQQHVLGRGDVHVQYHGRNPEYRAEEVMEDILTQYLKTLCTSLAVCRPVVLTFRTERRAAQTDQSGSMQLRRFTRGDKEYVTKLCPSLTLTCLDLQEMDYKVLCHLSSDRIEQNSRN